MAAISWMVLILNRECLPALVLRSDSSASESQTSAVALSLTVYPKEADRRRITTDGKAIPRIKEDFIIFS
jgi:hypothetical protein